MIDYNKINKQIREDNLREETTPRKKFYDRFADYDYQPGMIDYEEDYKLWLRERLVDVKMGG